MNEDWKDLVSRHPDAHYVLCAANKAPLGPWGENPASPESVLRHLENGGLVGIVPWSLGCAVIDLDTDAMKARLHVRRTIGEPATEMKSLSGRGSHMWYRQIVPIGNPRIEEEWGKGDIRCNHGYVVVTEPGKLLMDDHTPQVDVRRALRDSPYMNRCDRKKIKARTGKSHPAYRFNGSKVGKDKQREYLLDTGIAAVETGVTCPELKVKFTDWNATMVDPSFFGKDGAGFDMQVLQHMADAARHCEEASVEDVLEAFEQVTGRAPKSGAFVLSHLGERMSAGQKSGVARRLKTHDRDNRIVMMKKNGMSFAAIGSQLGINKSTVMRAYNRKAKAIA